MMMLHDRVLASTAPQRLVFIVVVWLECRAHLTTLAFAARNHGGRKNGPHSSGGGGGGFGSPLLSKKNPPSYTPDSSETTKHLMDFLESEECEGLEALEIGFDAISGSSTSSSSLRGIYAKQDLEAGSYLCAVPFVSSLLIDENFVNEDNDDDDNGDSVHLSAAREEKGKLFLENFVGDPKWQAYLASIPMSADDPNFSPTPEVWTKDEIQQLEMPWLVQSLLERKQRIENLAEESNLELGRLQHACWVVRTRAFTTLKKAITLDGTKGLLQRTVLIPLFDFINHSSTSSNAELKVIETKEYDESFYALVAKRRIPKGQQIRICYGSGKETSFDLYSKYGFLPQGHEKMDKKELEKWKIAWTTTLQDDLKALASASTGFQKEILTLRVHAKRLEQ